MGEEARKSEAKQNDWDNFALGGHLETCLPNLVGATVIKWVQAWDAAEDPARHRVAPNAPGAEVERL